MLHLPASVGGAAVVTSYSTPAEPIGPDKARVLVAHTATVAPADVKVDGKVVFTNIANGEFATADVPAGEHVVALLPTGQDTDPILGPLTVTLEPQTVTMVYAMGNPDDDSMSLVAHSAQLAADGTRGAVDDRHRVGGSGRRRRRHPLWRPAFLRAAARAWAASGYDGAHGTGRLRCSPPSCWSPLGLAWTATSLDRGDEPDIGARDESGRSSAPTTKPAGGPSATTSPVAGNPRTAHRDDTGGAPGNPAVEW